ncbi:putative receptor-like protein kinase At3g47110 isoform X2 [Populus nigra]|uniref:putative receptor-like protein kinase At3g47110 isoform X2 n=1 Tax=Populus nigra TaxID=3691 RepID=UPI002B277F3A|nr:putative receptor-like protein kinase At3g47110 isoform X2 [Populus nigra]
MTSRVVFWPFFGIYTFLLLSFHGLQVPCFSAEATSRIAKNETDQLALVEFKTHITNDPLGVLRSWNNSIHFCQWHGVLCGRRHQRVIALNLGSYKLAGYISPHVGNLSFLRLLDLKNNSLSQEIPPELGNLSRLKYLYLHNNSLSGKIPSNVSFCFNLVHFLVNWNRLVGKIPAEFATLSKLEMFFIHANNLTGGIPTTFGNLTSLQRFSATQNYIGGSIPATIGKLANLTHIALSGNRLSGSIPPSFFNLSSIIAFDIAYNQLEGTLPSNLGITLPNLQTLGLSANQFTGSIPFTISNATNLEYLASNDNKHTGSVPTLERLNRLGFLSLTSNHLGSGRNSDLDFLRSLLNATYLEILALNDNNFGGIFPEFIGNFTWLTILFLDGNRISGSIPNGIQNLVNLEIMELWENQISGGIPPEIGHLQQLDRLRLSRNRLSGSIPSSLGNLTSLTSLYLGQNNLQGSIPSSLGLCENLLELDLSQNYLSGTIPKELVSLSALSIFMNLSHNLLNGYLPEDVGNLKNLGALDVSDNMLSGEIPTSLGSCVTLEILRVQRNFLSGELPSSLRSLKGIRILDLSRNNLTGQLPKFLEQFDLQYLNLSFNDFDGEMLVQGVFKNASVVSVEGNSRLCGGVPELQLPPCKFQNSTKERLAPKFKIIISVVFGVLGVTTLLSTVYFCWLRKKGKGPDLSNSENLTLRLSYQSLVAATDGFSSAHLIGEGSFGSVYKGVIDELGTTVAIKVLNLLRRGASKSFAAECEALRNIRHRNLVKILTACSGVDYKGNDFKALIYEFMVNGSLEKWLHTTPITDEVNEAPRSLNLLQRLNIAIDVASALEYLHNDCQPPVVHCDLKPSNILLDEDMTAHVGDFGIARILPEAAMNLSNNVTSSIGVRGTTGYTAPATESFCWRCSLERDLQMTCSKTV